VRQVAGLAGGSLIRRPYKSRRRLVAIVALQIHEQNCYPLFRLLLLLSCSLSTGLHFFVFCASIHCTDVLGFVHEKHFVDKGSSSDADISTFWCKNHRIFRNLWCVRMDKGRLSQCGQWERDKFFAVLYERAPLTVETGVCCIQAFHFEFET